MANRSNPNPRRGGGSPAGDMDETQVFRPVRGGQNYSNAQNSGYSNDSGYYDGSYDDSYNNAYQSGYNGYNNYNSGYDSEYDYDQGGYDQGYDQGYNQGGYNQGYDNGYSDGYYDDGYQQPARPRETLASRAAGRSNTEPYRRPSGHANSSRNQKAARRERYDDGYQQPAPRRRRKKKHHPFRNFLIFLLILAALIAGVYFLLFRAPTQSQDGVHTRKDGFYNILLCATDEEGTRTDTIMIATLDQKNGQISLTSIPRDTIVDNGEAVPKINGVYAIAGCGDAGANALMDQVETLLGFRPDGYAIISYEIFKDVVDAMGGITFDVPMDMEVDGTYISGGEQELDGDLALKVCRFRHGYAMADIQREYVQQTFIKAMAKQCMSPSMLPKFPAIYKAAMANIITDLDDANLRYLALHVLLAGTGDIQQNTLPGEGVSYNGASCYGLYGQSVVDLVNQVMNPYTEDLTIGDVHILTVSEGSLVESTWTGTAFDASTYQYN